jgi:hypothetical protein
VVQGTRIRLYPTEQGVGVGRRGRTETYVECQPALLRDDHAGYLWLLFSAEALSVNGTLSQLLESSRRFAGDLAERLRDRIYTEVVPALAAGIAVARGHKASTAHDLDLNYQMALTVLFRLLFIAYEDYHSYHGRLALPTGWRGLASIRPPLADREPRPLSHMLEGRHTHQCV